VRIDVRVVGVESSAPGHVSLVRFGGVGRQGDNSLIVLDGRIELFELRVEVAEVHVNVRDRDVGDELL
jgi:hypothetical protein